MKYMMQPKVTRQTSNPDLSGLVVLMMDGIVSVVGLDTIDIPSRRDFQKDLVELWSVAKDPDVKAVAMSRLRKLSHEFKTYILDHAGTEMKELIPIHKDIYSVMKVDNHVHLAAAMPPRLLLNFIRDKVRHEGD